MKVKVLRNRVPPEAAPDEQDVLVQVEAVTAALERLGHQASVLACDLDLQSLARSLAADPPDLVFNLVESLAGSGRLIAHVPGLLDALGMPYTGAPTESLILTSNKLLAKAWMRAAGLPVAPTLAVFPPGGPSLPGAMTAPAMSAPAMTFPAMTFPAMTVPAMTAPGATPSRGDPQEAPHPSAPQAPAPRTLVKSVWEHASIGLEEDALLEGIPGLEELARRAPSLGGACFAEPFVDGRELNLSMLASAGGAPSGGAPQVLPPAEIDFSAFEPGKPRMVGYRAKWDEGSFEHSHTPRRFEFPPSDGPLLAHLEEIARRAWRVMGLRGYARVDFRVDTGGRPFILEVNANPCLSPDAGLAAAAARSGMDLTDVVSRILADTAAPRHVDLLRMSPLPLSSGHEAHPPRNLCQEDPGAQGPRDAASQHEPNAHVPHPPDLR